MNEGLRIHIKKSLDFGRSTLEAKERSSTVDEIPKTAKMRLFAKRNES